MYALFGIIPVEGWSKMELVKSDQDFFGFDFVPSFTVVVVVTQCCSCNPIANDAAVRCNPISNVYVVYFCCFKLIV